MNEKYTEYYFETKKNFHLTILRQGICGEQKYQLEMSIMLQYIVPNTR